MTTDFTKRRARLAGAMLAGALLASHAPVRAAADAGQKAGLESRTLVLVEVGTAVHVVDVPARAADGAAGDLSTFESNLLRNGAVVGTLAGHCIQLRADGSLDDCDVVVTLGHGSFRMSGLFDPVKGGTFAITGGTGAFVGAAGTDTIVNQPDGTAVHTVRLQRR